MKYVIATLIFAFFACAGAYDLIINAQNGLRLLFTGVALSIIFYFALFGMIVKFVHDTEDQGEFTSSNETKGRIWAVSLLLSVLFLELINYALLSEVKEYEGVIVNKLLKKDKFGHPREWRLVLNDDLYLYVTYSNGDSVSKGDKIKLKYKDGILGVRYVKNYKIEPANKILSSDSRSRGGER